MPPFLSRFPLLLGADVCDARQKQELLDEFFDHRPFLVASIVMALVIVQVCLSGQTPTALMAAGMLVCALFVRIMTAEAYRRYGRGGDERRWLRIFAAMCVAIAMLWGSTGAVLYGAADANMRLAVLAIGCVLIQAVTLRTYMAPGPTLAQVFILIAFHLPVLVADGLTVLVPIYNEAASLAVFVERTVAAPCPIEREFVFIDDGSTDNSPQLLEELSKRYPLRLLDQDSNRGKGMAIQRGIDEAAGDLVMIQDADFEYDPHDVPALLEPILDGRADVVYGSRFKQGAPQVHRTYHYGVNRVLTFLSNLLSGIYLTDMETCYKIFPTDLLRSMNLTSRRFGIEVELTAYLAGTSARVFELPIAYRPRTRLQGKKINWKDGVAALFHLVRYNLRPRSRAFGEIPERFRP